MTDHITPSCPFCPFSDQDATFVEQHIEYCHPEGGASPSHYDSPAFENPSPSPSTSPVDEDSTEKYIDCPHGCGETITTAELATHLDLHVAEGIALDDCGAVQSPFNAELSSEPDIPTDLEDRDYPVSQKGSKRGPDRAFARPTSKQTQPRSHSPVGKPDPNGVKRLGVSTYPPTYLPNYTGL
jgi:hypothetical protein